MRAAQFGVAWQSCTCTKSGFHGGICLGLKVLVEGEQGRPAGEHVNCRGEYPTSNLSVVWCQWSFGQVGRYFLIAPQQVEWQLKGSVAG